LATAVFLELNGVGAVDAGNDDVYDLVVGVAAGHESVDEVAAKLRAIVTGH
jgi:prophage maintenance system killer protein